MKSIFLYNIYRFAYIKLFLLVWVMAMTFNIRTHNETQLEDEW